MSDKKSCECYSSLLLIVDALRTANSSVGGEIFVVLKGRVQLRQMSLFSASVLLGMTHRDCYGDKATTSAGRDLDKLVQATDRKDFCNRGA